MSKRDHAAAQTRSDAVAECPDCGARRGEESGFTLIELIIVALIIPIIIGAITLALISIFSLQGSTASRISDSADAQVVSSNFETDVQNATQITYGVFRRHPSVRADPSVASAVQVLGLQSADNGGTVISYADVPNGNSGHSLVRYVCQGGANYVSRQFHRHLEQRTRLVTR